MIHIADRIGVHGHRGQFVPFYVPRENMPQIDTGHIPRLVADWRFNGLKARHEHLDCRLLRAHQRVSEKNVRSLTEAHLLQPIITSSDNFVIDGNHRWHAHMERGKYLAPAITLLAPFDYCIEWLNLRPYVYHKAEDQR